MSQTEKSCFPVTFRFEPLAGGVEKVFVAGDFNQWNPIANQLHEEGGVYSLTIQLPRGKYAYKFVVDGRWIADPNADSYSSDFLGEDNAIVEVGKNVTGLRIVDFVLEGHPDAEKVFVTGDFCAWKPNQFLMRKDSQKIWHKQLVLDSGQHPYKFVLNGDTYISDPDAIHTTEDGFGGVNSLKIVDEFCPEAIPQKRNNVVLTAMFGNDEQIAGCNLLEPGIIEFSAKAFLNDIERIELLIGDITFTMRETYRDSQFVYYKREVPIEKSDYRYLFKYIDGNTILYYGQEGFTAETGKWFRFNTDSAAAFFTPEWVCNGIIYQIFPDRFANGNPALNPDFYEWYYSGKNTLPPPDEKLRWGQQYYHFVNNWTDSSPLKLNPLHSEEKPDWWCFYGGDIPGINQKLDYLEELGVTILYLNPIFEARSNHRYDAADFKKLDPRLGKTEDFQKFVK
ncbi:MAG: alpha amylase N-terminal ig-like domain-containing protein, partial [Candidatus Cloacimonetes bacterium]|nr:alpha amylase N-terminal ig-like domain-containing protein [Candidatus Cloacimonadota bacterium]